MQALTELLLRPGLQIWPDSAVGAFNLLAYAILGIPTIIFGASMLRENKVLRIGGILLIPTALACFLCIVGAMAQNAALSFGTIIGGWLFLLALILIGLCYLRQ